MRKWPQILERCFRAYSDLMLKTYYLLPVRTLKTPASIHLISGAFQAFLKTHPYQVAVCLGGLETASDFDFILFYVLHFVYVITASAFQSSFRICFLTV